MGQQSGAFGAPTSLGMSAKNVLVVDDEPNIVLSLEFLMKQAGYSVRTAGDGESAMQAIQSDPPDLVLLDVNMPRRSGYDVCEAVRADPALKKVRIIMLTAKGRDIEREKGLALGADDYVTKPFATQEVVDKVQALLGN
jgi:DNA-binding response OmpR family regulator